MDKTTIHTYIVDTYEGVETVTHLGDTFFFYDPEKMFPFATVVTSNAHDDVSDLDRPGVYRLNIGIGKQTFMNLFGSRAGDISGDAFDYTAFDRVMPHPVYGKMYWVCILNPTDETFQNVLRPLLTEAYELSVEKQAKKLKTTDN